ncbi:MAG: histidine kinase [Actinomycetota bacterium]
MASTTIRSLLDEPAVADPPERVWRDWVLAGLAVVGAIAELILRDDLALRIPSFLLAVAGIPLLFVRRTRPLLASALIFGSFVVFSVPSGLTDQGQAGMYTSAYSVLFAYALFRWASGRHAAIGLAFIVAAAVVGNIVERASIGEVIGGTIFLSFPCTLGLIVRERATARTRAVRQVQLEERQSLARELHDTVAHHVSAIAIQAQAGRTAGATRPEAAAEALRVIEEEASRTLAEMRGIVGALRRDDGRLEGSRRQADDRPDPRRPSFGLADLDELAETMSTVLPIHVTVSPDARRVGSAVDAALYRIAQEAITNAVRHAADATHVVVTADVITSLADSRETDADVVTEHVRLVVRDDGRASNPASGGGGFGLVGMAERADLLGGTFSAGPHPGGGWSVTATFPLGERSVLDRATDAVDPSVVSS